MIKVSTDFGLGINLYRIFEYQKPDFVHMPLTCNELSHCLIQSQQLLQSSGLWSYPVAFNKENDPITQQSKSSTEESVLAEYSRIFSFRRLRGPLSTEISF